MEKWTRTAPAASHASARLRTPSALIRKALAESPENFDPRKYLGPARDGLIGLMKHKNEEVLGSAGQG